MHGQIKIEKEVCLKFHCFVFCFLQNQGKDIADNELLDYISESSTMSKSLAEYGSQKSCAVTTARRLADFLGDTMVKDKGLRCQYIVACEPMVSMLKTFLWIIIIMKFRATCNALEYCFG